MLGNSINARALLATYYIALEVSPSKKEAIAAFIEYDSNDKGRLKVSHFDLKEEEILENQIFEFSFMERLNIKWDPSGSMVTIRGEKFIKQKNLISCKEYGWELPNLTWGEYDTLSCYWFLSGQNLYYLESNLSTPPILFQEEIVACAFENGKLWILDKNTTILMVNLKKKIVSKYKIQLPYLKNIELQACETALYIKGESETDKSMYTLIYKYSVKERRLEIFYQASLQPSNHHPFFKWFLLEEDQIVYLSNEGQGRTLSLLTSSKNPPERILTPELRILDCFFSALNKCGLILVSTYSKYGKACLYKADFKKTSMHLEKIPFLTNIIDRISFSYQTNEFIAVHQELNTLNWQLSIISPTDTRIIHKAPISLLHSLKTKTYRKNELRITFLEPFDSISPIIVYYIGPQNYFFLGPQTTYFQHSIVSLLLRLKIFGYNVVIIDGERKVELESKPINYFSYTQEIWKETITFLRHKTAAEIIVLGASLNALILFNFMAEVYNFSASVFINPVYSPEQLPFYLKAFFPNSYSKTIEMLAQDFVTPVMICQSLQDEVSPSRNSSTFISNLPRYINSRYLTLASEGHILKDFASWEKILLNTFHFLNLNCPLKQS